MSIFYTEVPEKVKKALSLRKQYYAAGSSSARDNSTYAWLYKKTAYAEATAKNSRTSKSAQLQVPTSGGLGANSLYQSNPNSNFIPKPHITSVKISSDGDLGSLMKCEIAFTVYTLTDLDAYQPFLDLGASISVNYGWTSGGDAAGIEGMFQGVIYNFSYTVDGSGGFSCVTYGIAAGSNILPVNITAGSEISEQTKDALGTTYASVNLIDTLQNLAAVEIPEHTVLNGIGKVRLEYSLADKEYDPREESKIEAYVTLEKLVALINENLLREFILGNMVSGLTDGTTVNAFANGPRPLPKKTGLTELPWYLRGGLYIKPRDFLIVCDDQFCKGLMPKKSTDLVSANPLQMIFPGFATYGKVTYFNNATEIKENFKQGDLSKILLNINWIKKLFNDIGAETQDRQKSADQSISKFLLNIFNAISDNSGTRFKLSLTTDPNNTEKFVISDINYVDGNVTPYILTAVNNQGICRTVSLTSQVPSAMSAVAFVSANSTATTQSTKAGTVLNATNASVKTETLELIRKQLTDSANKLASSDITDSDITKLRAILKRVYEFVPFNNANLGISDAKNSIPFPIDFSATLDGIEGFVFGNTVTTNYLPSIYKNTRVAFTIKKVDHVIQNNDWTTTISTICRLTPDEINESTENSYNNESVSVTNETKPTSSPYKTTTKMPIPVKYTGVGRRTK